MTPDIEFQKAVRAALLSAPGVAQHVPASNIREGSIRPEKMPAIVLGPMQLKILGRAAGGQVVAELRQLLHVWTVQGAPEARAIAFAAVSALVDAPAIEGVYIDAWERPALTWVSDPHPEQSHLHGAIALYAEIRWKE